MQGKRRKPFFRKAPPIQPANEGAVLQAERATPPSSASIDELCAGLARQILRHFPDGWGAILDRNFCCLLAEGPGLTKLGLSPEQLVGKTVDEVLPPEKAAQVTPYFRRAFAGEEVALKLSLGEQTFFLEVSLLQEASYPAGAILLIARNITSPHPLGAPLLAAQAEARQRESFISLVAHELRTPLTVISGLVQMLERGKIDEAKRAETLRKLREQTRRLQRLIDDLLDPRYEG
ncbi:MAG TPA: histidine kinase dimerization/phospho-acceptor domain-containing protein [Ktedonobacterales bacterium]|nr:histidine kinase dimerization/phospho-acceptor domain-containing protein [Ktedonobacterales bacterium]